MEEVDVPVYSPGNHPAYVLQQEPQQHSNETSGHTMPSIYPHHLRGPMTTTPSSSSLERTTGSFQASPYVPHHPVRLPSIATSTPPPSSIHHPSARHYSVANSHRNLRHSSRLRLPIPSASNLSYSSSKIDERRHLQLSQPHFEPFRSPSRPSFSPLGFIPSY